MSCSHTHQQSTKSIMYTFSYKVTVLTHKVLLVNLTNTVQYVFTSVHIPFSIEDLSAAGQKRATCSRCSNISSFFSRQQAVDTGSSPSEHFILPPLARVTISRGSRIGSEYSHPGRPERHLFSSPTLDWVPLTRFRIDVERQQRERRGDGPRVQYCKFTVHWTLYCMYSTVQSD